MSAKKVENSTYFIRDSRDRDFTIISNEFLHDDRLSWKAKGLFTYILSLPENWKIYQSELIKHSPDGETAVKSAIKELKDCGYIAQSREKKNGRFSWEYKIIEAPSKIKTKSQLQKEFDKLVAEVKCAEANGSVSEAEKSVNNVITTTATAEVKAEPVTVKKPVEQKIVAEKPKAKAEAKPKKKPLLEREPESDLEELEKVYLQNWETLYRQKIVQTEKPIINWARARRQEKELIKKYGVPLVKKAIENSFYNKFCVEKGYCLTTILSESVLNGLLNNSSNTGTSCNRGFMIGQGIDRFEGTVDF